MGDALEDRISYFFTKHQDSNYNNGNGEFSGMRLRVRKQCDFSLPGSDAGDDDGTSNQGLLKLENKSDHHSLDDTNSIESEIDRYQMLDDQVDENMERIYMQ